MISHKEVELCAMLGYGPNISKRHRLKSFKEINTVAGTHNILAYLSPLSKSPHSLSCQAFALFPPPLPKNGLEFFKLPDMPQIDNYTITDIFFCQKQKQCVYFQKGLHKV
jgi:hypothetical protein